jgi:hypothetical protein
MPGVKLRELVFQLEGWKKKLEELRMNEKGELKPRGLRGAVAVEALLAKLSPKTVSPTDVHSPAAFGLSSLRVPDYAVHALSASVLSSRDSPFDDSLESATVLALKQQLEEARKAAADEKRKNKAAAEARNAEEVHNLKAKAAQAKAEATQAKAELEALRAAAAKDLAAVIAAAKAAAPVPIAPEPAQPQVGRNISLAEDLVLQETARRTAVCQLFTLSICT